MPPRFLIIDDGWQSINMDHESPSEDSNDLRGLGSQMPCRLYRFKESNKFAKYRVGTMLSPDVPSFDQDKHNKMFREMVAAAAEEEARGDPSALPKAPPFIDNWKEEGEGGGLKALISDLKGKFECLDDVYVWHALCGGWGGVKPGTIHLDVKVVSAKMAARLEKTMSDLAAVMIVTGGTGLVNQNPAAELYESMHSYLADHVGVTRVKLNVIHASTVCCAISNSH